MKTLLVSINSKYIHSNLALLYIMSNREYHDIVFTEYTINNRYMDILSDILAHEVEHICFSCYIWNIELVEKLCADIKKVSDILITLAGPQADYNHKEYINSFHIDYIYRGEGEKGFIDYLELMGNGKIPDYITTKNKIAEKRYITCDLDKVKSPYSTDNILEFKNKLVYYETSRGCPYNCSYCLSSAEKGVRFLSLEKIRRDFELFVSNNICTVKLVDRTFNTDEKRSVEIVEIIKELRLKYPESKTIFHFEVVASIIKEPLLVVLQSLPHEYVQLEIGIQSIKEKTLESIGRKVDINRQTDVIKALLKNKNIHIHLDIIAGMPFDSFSTTMESLEYMLSFGAHCCQLGILKLLSGAEINSQKELHEYKFSAKTPYEILANKYISFKELQKIKEYEDIVDRVYNQGCFKKTWNALVNKYGSAVAFLDEFNNWLINNVARDSSRGIREMFLYLFEFADDRQIRELIKLDYLGMGYPKYIPDWMNLPNVKTEKNAITAEQLMAFGVITDFVDARHLKKIKNNIFITTLNIDIKLQKYSKKEKKYLFCYTGESNRLSELNYFCLD